MGLGIGVSRCEQASVTQVRDGGVTWREASSVGAPQPPNPDPRNFRVLRHFPVGPWLVVEVLYPDCRNYEGKKIMLYRAPSSVLRVLSSLDPHFCDHADHLSPFARFEPTPRGWDAAVVMANAMLQRESDFVDGDQKTRWDHLLDGDNEP